jgi:hypothetical protein
LISLSEELVAKPRNDRDLAVTKFCLAMEDHRRTDAGRVRTAKELVAQFFPYDEQKATDRLFLHMPNDVRGPVLAKWGIRGAKAALKDDDAKVQFVVHDALVAGDIDDGIFEEGITSSILVDWIVLADWWSFWRHGKLTGVAIQKALATAREVGLIDDRWFLENLQGRGGKLRGTDVVCDTLSKDQIITWLRKLHESGDASPAGMVAALGWETILSKTAQDALLHALDQFARKVGLTPEPAAETSKDLAATTDEHKVAGGAPPPSQDATTGKHDKLAEAHPTVSVPGDMAALAAADAFAQAKAEATAALPKRDSGFPVAIPDIPAVDGGDADDEPPSIPSVEWSSKEVDESPKLAQARAAMMQTLISSEKSTGDGKRESWDGSEIPAKPSSLEWPEPPPSRPSSDPPISLDENDLQKASSPHLPVPQPPPIPRKPNDTPQ